MASSDKIRPLDALASLLDAARAEGKRIVQCHGVFDLLHIGHIKHLQAARLLGDVLVVTITPDHLVNKGPHRPAFAEQLRAEALAALECVDYVAVNRWPTAVEVIHLLRPDLFVKGRVAGEGPRDHTDAIVKEEEAVKAVGGGIHFTEEATFSASALINRYLDVFSPEVKQYLEAFRIRYTADAVVGLLQSLRGLKVLAIGEAVVDEYVFCDVAGKASKDPILAAQFKYAERYGGGILAVANHLAGFCDQVGVVSFLGDRDSQEPFVRSALAPNVDARFFRKSGSPTIAKRRFLEEYLNTKLLEVDVMNEAPLCGTDETAFCAMLEEMLPQYDAVVVADYGHGLFTEQSIALLCEKAPFLAVNVQATPGNSGHNLVSRYARADFVVIDEPEARLEMRPLGAGIEDVAEVLAKSLRCKAFLLTRGQNGTVCYDPASGFCRTPVFSVKLVDRTGAGDACLALSAPCAAVGAPAEVLGFIGNVAGAAACGIIGNKSAIDPPSLFRYIASLLQ